jgi:hypothetical protein
VKRSTILLPLTLIALLASGCATMMGLNAPEKHRGDGTHRIVAGTVEEVRAGVHTFFGKLGTDFVVSDQGDMVQAVYDKGMVAFGYKAFLSPGPTAGETDVEMVCEMFRSMKSEDIKQCENNFLSAVADSAELAHLKKTVVSADVAKSRDEPKTLSLKSDIDELPAVKARTSRRSYAIVIGIENYRQKLPKADFATQDARLVSEYLMKTMGYPEENVIILTNDRASYVDLAKYFEKWLPNNVEAGGTVFVYYSGHGAPNPKTGDAYLVPYDGDPSFIDETGYSLKRMYAALVKLPAKEVTVALDSCFSGAGGRSVIAKGSRPLVMNLQQPIASSKNMTILTASSGEQISSTYQDKGHGLFTYFLLKGIKNEDVVKQDGTLDISSLYDYLKPQVTSIARKKYNNEQTPQLMGAK